MRKKFYVKRGHFEKGKCRYIEKEERRFAWKFPGNKWWHSGLNRLALCQSMG